jgi:hypothetical protein
VRVLEVIVFGLSLFFHYTVKVLSKSLKSIVQSFHLHKISLLIQIVISIYWNETDVLEFPDNFLKTYFLCLCGFIHIFSIFQIDVLYCTVNQIII